MKSNSSEIRQVENLKNSWKKLGKLKLKRTRNMEWKSNKRFGMWRNSRTNLETPRGKTRKKEKQKRLGKEFYKKAKFGKIQHIISTAQI
ncbi:hypothetical protein HYE35_01605 [Mycoplasmopsis bovis]|nr:hypothetical protein [Mycoplasmopsis bovis]QQH21646.1 hypothetical protein HYE35_01605 [Mycoplasmopsis bovis]